MTAWHAEHVWLGGDTAVADVLLEADGDRLTAVTPGVPCPPSATRLPGLTLPGLVNAHSHAFHRALRGNAQGRGSFWTWREQMYAVAVRLDPDSYLALATATYAEMALAGISCVGEFHYLHHAPGGRPYDDPNAMSAALVEAARRAGVRLTLLDTCYLRGGFDAPLAGPQLRFGDGSVDAWAERADLLEDAEGVRVGAAVHSVRAVPVEALPVVADWAARRAAPLHAHLSEQRAENAACCAATGRTPAQLLAGAGALGPRTTLVHATHLTPQDVRLLGSSRSTVCLCPTTERDLADGVGPAPELTAAGCRLSLGSDSSAVVDLLAEAAAVELDERLRSEVRGTFTAPDLLRAATAAGSLGWDAGALVPGALADLTTVALDGVRTAGIADPLAAVFAATAADVRSLVVGGRQVVAEGRHRLVRDVPGALRASIRAVLA